MDGKHLIVLRKALVVLVLAINVNTAFAGRAAVSIDLRSCFEKTG